MADELTAMEQCKKEIKESLEKHQCVILSDVRIVGGKIISSVIVVEKKKEEDKA